MIDLKYNTVKPLIMSQTRLTALSCGANFGLCDEDDRLSRMNNFLSHLGSRDVSDLYQNMRDRPMPDLSRERVTGDYGLMSDLLLSDTFRQSMGLEERYRKNMVTYYDLNRIGEPMTKLGVSMSRGYERHLVDSLGRLDNEFLNRQSIKPVVS